MLFFFVIFFIRFGHMMGLAPDATSGSSARVPLVLGGGGVAVPGTPISQITEIYDPINNEWKVYQELMYAGWNAIQCLVQYNDNVYSIWGDQVAVLHTPSWTFEVLGAPPDFIEFNGKCSIAEINGTQGHFCLNFVFLYI